MNLKILSQIYNYLTNTKKFIITTTDGQEIGIEAGTKAIDFSLMEMTIDPDTDNPQVISWTQVAMLTFEYSNGKSLSITL